MCVYLSVYESYINLRLNHAHTYIRSDRANGIEGVCGNGGAQQCGISWTSLCTHPLPRGEALLRLYSGSMQALFRLCVYMRCLEEAQRNVLNPFPNTKTKT